MHKELNVAGNSAQLTQVVIQPPLPPQSPQPPQPPGLGVMHEELKVAENSRWQSPNPTHQLPQQPGLITTV